MWGAGGRVSDRASPALWAGHLVLAGVGAEEEAAGERGAGPRGLATATADHSLCALTALQYTHLPPPHLGETPWRHRNSVVREGWISPQDSEASGPSKH